MCPPPASGKGGRPMTRTREISGSGQIFALLVLSQCFWLLCCRPSLVNGLLSMAASAVAYGVVFLLAVFCRRCAARGETPLSPVFAAWGALLAVGYFAVTAEQLLSAARVLFEGVFSPLLLLLVLLGAVWAAAAAGQEALGRAAFVSLFLFLIAVLLLTLGVLPQAIEKVLRGSGHAGQNMVIRVTDEALLQKTGGILQGMSGSPLVQNGMLVGAVTHVFVDEPDRGYAIFAETVRNAEKNLDQTTRNAA